MVKQPYLERVRTLTMKGKGAPLPEEPPPPPTPVQSKVMVENTTTETGEKATIDVPISPLRRQLNDEANEVGYQIAKGVKALADYEQQHGVPPSTWVDRLVELHEQQLAKFLDLDRVRVYEAPTLKVDVGTVCSCVLHRASVEAEGYLKGKLPDEDGAAALERLCTAIDADDEDQALEGAKAYVAAAVRYRYAGGPNA